MSKVDAQRALRDARYAAYRARQQSEAQSEGQTARESAVKPVPARPVAEAAPQIVAAAEESETLPEGTPALCGHRNMGNKSCTRLAGHPEKSHRYS